MLDCGLHFAYEGGEVSDRMIDQCGESTWKWQMSAECANSQSCFLQRQPAAADCQLDGHSSLCEALRIGPKIVALANIFSSCH